VLTTRQIANRPDGFAVALGGLAVIPAGFLAIATAAIAGGPIAVAALGGVVGVPIAAAMAESRAKRRRAERRAAEDQDAEAAMWLAYLWQFDQELHHAVTVLNTPEAAYGLWSSVGLAITPDQSRAAMPILIEGDDDFGIWRLPSGNARARFRMLVGQSHADFATALDELAHGLRVDSVRIHSADRSVIELDLKVRDPLAGMNVSQLLDPATRERIAVAAKRAGTPAELTRALTAACRGARLTVPVDGLSCTDDIPLLISETGEWITVNLAAGAHGGIQGASRSGKSIFLNSLLAWASLMRDVRVVIIDPNSAAVAPWWRTAYLACNSNDPAEATKILAQVNKELKAREHLFWEGRTDRITEFSPEVPLYLVVIDEVPEYAGDKNFQAELKRFGAQSAKFGGRGYPAGQKLDENSLSTATRANLFDRFCFRVESRHDMAHLFENTPELMAAGYTAVDESMPQGTAIVRTRSHPETTRGRAVYMPTEACWIISDAIVAVRGEVRPLPGSTPARSTQASAPAPGAPAASQVPATAPQDTASPAPVRLPKLPTALRAPRAESEQEPERTVIPFPAQDTGTE
jgi:hypothetical protein